MTKPSYEDLVEIIALALFPRFELNHEGKLEIVHLASNNFELPCDTLAQLGVLKSDSTGHRHEFCVPWHPGAPLPIVRSAKEPSYNDLATDLIRAFHWWGNGVDANQEYLFDASNAPSPPSTSDRYF